MKGRKIATQMGKGEEDRRINKCRPSYFLRHAPLTHLLRRRRPYIGRCGVWLIFIGGLNSTKERYPPPLQLFITGLANKRRALEVRRTNFFWNARRNMMISSTLLTLNPLSRKTNKTHSLAPLPYTLRQAKDHHLCFKSANQRHAITASKVPFFFRQL